MTAINKSKPILITGANGYVAGWIICQFLDKGFKVHTTAANRSETTADSQLAQMAAASEGELKIFKADPLDPGSHDAAMQHCELVLHTASLPHVSKLEDADAALVNPASSSLRNVLDSVNRCKTVRQVVLTSGVAAIYGDTGDARLAHNGILTEKHWNSTSSAGHLPRKYARTVVERLAWKICDQQNRWKLVVINPGLMFGPTLGRMNPSEGTRIMIRLSDGSFKRGVPQLGLPIVDVRDVAHAHYKAALSPVANGRNIVVAGEVTLLDLSKRLRQEFGPGYPFPTRQLPKLLMWLIAPLCGFTRAFVSKNVGYPITMSTRQSRENLMLSYRSIDETVIDHFQQLLDEGLITPRAETTHKYDKQALRLERH